MNTPVPANLTTYPTVAGQRYRLYGVVRGSVIFTDLSNALVSNGMTGLTLYYSPGTTAPALPTDWPAYTPVPLSADETPFWAEATMSFASPFPTSIAIGSNSAIIYNVWSYTPDVSPNPNLTNMSLTTTTAANPPVSGSVWLVGGALLAAGFLGALYVFSKPAMVYANPVKMYELYVDGKLKRRSSDFNRIHLEYAKRIEDAEKQDGSGPSTIVLFGDDVVIARYEKGTRNPIQYQTTITYRGIPLHVHQFAYDDKTGYCADYRAVEQVVAGAGGQVCASTQAEAVASAKQKLDRVLGAPRKVAQRPLAPSPWD
jgi:hypothetical protein